MVGEVCCDDTLTALANNGSFIHFTFGSMKDRCALFVELTSPCVASGWGCVMVTGQFKMDQNIDLIHLIKKLHSSRGLRLAVDTSTFINTRGSWFYSPNLLLFFSQFVYEGKIPF